MMFIYNFCIYIIQTIYFLTGTEKGGLQVNYSKLKNLSFNEIDSLLDYITNGEEELVEVIFKKKSILIKTNHNMYYCEELENDSNGRYGYGEIWNI